MLKATLTIRPLRGRPEELRAVATITNSGTAPVTINPAPLSSPSLAVQVEDAAGAPFALPPPPIPGAPFPLVNLAVGGSYTVEPGMFLPSWTRPGRYRVRLRYVSFTRQPAPDEWTGEAVSDWVAVDVVE